MIIYRWKSKQISRQARRFIIYIYIYIHIYIYTHIHIHLYISTYLFNRRILGDVVAPCLQTASFSVLFGTFIYIYIFIYTYIYIYTYVYNLPPSPSPTPNQRAFEIIVAIFYNYTTDATHNT